MWLAQYYIRTSAEQSWRDTPSVEWVLSLGKFAPILTVQIPLQDLELAREYNPERAYCPLCLSLFSPSTLFSIT